MVWKPSVSCLPIRAFTLNLARVDAVLNLPGQAQKVELTATLRSDHSFRAEDTSMSPTPHFPANSPWEPNGLASLPKVAIVRPAKLTPRKSQYLRNEAKETTLAVERAGSSIQSGIQAQEDLMLLHRKCPERHLFPLCL